MTPDPRSEELARIVREAASEIQRLRADNERLSAGMRVLDIIERAMSIPHHGTGYAPDICQTLDRLAEHYKAKKEAKAERPDYPEESVTAPGRHDAYR